MASPNSDLLWLLQQRGERHRIVIETKRQDQGHLGNLLTFQRSPLEIIANPVNGKGISQSIQTTWISSPDAGNLFRENLFGGSSPQTLKLRTYHLLLGSNNCGLSTERRAKIPSRSHIEPRELHKNLTIDSFLSSYF